MSGTPSSAWETAVNAFFVAAVTSFDANGTMSEMLTLGAPPSALAYNVSAVLAVAILLIALASLGERALRRHLRAHRRSGMAKRAVAEPATRSS
jgi:hypothetical protein